jgi:hypothetical protein
MEELHKHVDAEILPSEYGGGQGPLDNSPIREAVDRFENYYMEVKSCEEKYNSDKRKS